MAEAHMDCPVCETRIRFRSGLPDRDWISCPRCGEEIPLAGVSRPRASSRREPVRQSRERSVSRRAAPRRPSRQVESNGSLGLWIGVIGGSVGILGLILGLVLYFNSREADDASLENSEAIAQDSNRTVPEGQASSKPAFNNPLAIFNSEDAKPPAASTQAPAQAPAGRGGNPTPTLGPGPDGVIPAPPAAAGGNNAADSGNRLKYGYKTNQEFAYHVTIKAETGADRIHETRGMAKFSVGPPDPQLAKLFEEEAAEQLSTGSGFVVHPDGYLMTCAHVVEGATKIEVELDGKKYAARVIEINSQRDLALVRISARNLPVLPLANSDQLELAQHVRLVGYPLADVLGTSVKVTQGSVAGFIDRANGRMIQVDASMNPGNSGGPLVNDRGDAIGVASAGYFGSEIAEVGLAVPVNDVADLMRKNGVTPVASTAGGKLDGPELARKVTPSVAFFQVVMGSAPKESLVLNHFGAFASLETHKDGRATPGSVRTPMQSDGGKLLVDEFGQILHGEAVKTTLPFGLGPISHLVIEPLSPEGETSWGTQRLSTITQVVRRDSRYDPFAGYDRFPRSRYGRHRPLPPPRSPYGRGGSTETTKTHLALEISEYELAESSKDSQVINKTYAFQTIDDDEQPYYRLFGTGSIRFDRVRQLPDEIHYQLQLQIRSDDGRVSNVPIDILCVRYTDEELADHNRRVKDVKPTPQQGQSRASATPSNPPAAVPPIATPAKPAQVPEVSLDEQLAMVKNPSANFSQKYVALNAIIKMPPDEKRRKDVLDAVEPLLKDSNLSLQNTAIRLFGVWGTEDRAGVLIEMAGGYSQPHRWDAMRALGQIGGKKSAEAVAKRLTDQTDSLTAAHALKQMGIVAEEPTLKHIDHPDQPVRYQVYLVLGEVGGEKSRAAFADNAQTDPNNFNRAAAQIALRKLEQR